MKTYDADDTGIGPNRTPPETDRRKNPWGYCGLGGTGVSCAL